MTKRFISWMLTLAMCLSLVSIPAMADGVETPSVTKAHFSSETSVETDKGTTYTVVKGTVAYVAEYLNPDLLYTLVVYQSEDEGKTAQGKPYYVTSLKPDNNGGLSGTIPLNDEDTTSILQEINGWYLGVIPVGERELVAFKPLTKDTGFEPLPVIVKGPAYVDLELGPNPATAKLDGEPTLVDAGETQIITVKISGDNLMASETAQGSGEYYAIGGVGIPHFDGVAYRGGWFASEDNTMPALDDKGWTVLTKTNGLITETVGEEPDQKTYDVFYLQLTPEILSDHEGELPYLCVTADGKNYIYKLDISAVKLATVTFDANGKDVVCGDQTYMLHGDTELVRAGQLFAKAPVLESTDNAVFKGWYRSTDDDMKIVVDEKGELVEAEGDETRDATYMPDDIYYPKWVNQYNVKITVVEAKDEKTPISGADVTLGGVKLSPVTGEPGVYATSAKVEEGKYALTVSKTLYGTHTDAEFEVGDKNYSTEDDAVIKKVTLTPIVYKVGVSLANGAGDIASVYRASGDLGSYQLSDPDANNTYNVTGKANYIQMDEFLGVKKENDEAGTYTRGYYLAAHFTQPKYTEGTEEKTFTNGYKVAINGTEYNWAQAFDETVGNEKVLEIVKHIYNKEDVDKTYTVSFYLTEESKAPELTYTVDWSGVTFSGLQDFVIDKVTIDWDNENSVYVATADSLPYGIKLNVYGDKVKIEGTADEQAVKFDADVTFEKGDHVDGSVIGIKKKSVSENCTEVTFTLLGPLPVIVKGPYYADPALGQNPATATLVDAAAGEAGETQIITVTIGGTNLMASKIAQNSDLYYAVGGVGIPHFDGVEYKGGWFASENDAKAALNGQGWTVLKNRLTQETIGDDDDAKTYDVFYLQLSPEILSEHEGMLPYLCATVDGKNYIYKLDISAVTLATVTFDANGTTEGGDETYMLHGDTQLVRAGKLYVNAPVLESTDNAVFKGWYLSTDTEQKIVVDEKGALVRAEGAGTQNATYTPGDTYYPKWVKQYGVEIKVVDAKDGTTLISGAEVKLGDVTLSPVEGKRGFYATTANVKEGTYKLTITKALYKSFEEEEFIVSEEEQLVDESGKISKTAQLIPVEYTVGVSLANGANNIASVYGASGPLGSYQLSGPDANNTYYVTGTANYIQMDEFLGVEKENDASGTYTRGYYLAAHFTQPKYTEGTEDKTFTNGYKVAINGTKYNWAQAFDETVGNEKVLEIVKHIYKQDAAKAYTVSFYLTEESTAPELTYTVDWSGVTFGKLEDFVISEVTIDWNEKDNVYVATADSLPHGIKLTVEGDKVKIDGTADEQDVKFAADVTFETGDHVDESITIEKKSVSENGKEVTFTLVMPEPPVVAAPKIVYNEDGTLSLQAENGAVIYYTTNGEDVNLETGKVFDGEQSQYTEKTHGLWKYENEKIKITMNHVSTIKAVAKLNGVTSEQLEFNKPVLDKDTTKYTADSGKLPVQIAHYDDYAEYMNGKLYFGFQYQKQYTLETSTLRGGMTLTFEENDMTFPEDALLVEVWIFDKPVDVNNSAEVSAHLVDAYKWAGQN